MFIAGNFNGHAGAAETYTEVNLFNVKLNSGASLKTGIPVSHNTALLVVEGSIIVNGKEVEEHSFVLFKNDGEEIEMSATKNSVILVLSGSLSRNPLPAMVLL
ncbi:hypothetical protein KRR40_14610 [Niabella defluvii]|nr:hypothetical protein KRR40_14610 [Niabella sp. I65]